MGIQEEELADKSIGSEIIDLKSLIKKEFVVGLEREEMEREAPAVKCEKNWKRSYFMGICSKIGLV